MNYQDTIAYLFDNLPMFQRTGKAAYKANLDNTIRLDRYFNHPHRNFKSIHVAGTNGKGSVSHMLASVFQKSGFKTGLYTSPHLLDFRERIRINGEMIPEQEVINFVANHRKIFEEIMPSFFEMTVAMAFDYFSNQNVDIAVVETGLGGRLDSTNILTPELSIITNISRDHTEFLGNSIELIAEEKAGIIKPGTPVVIGTSDVSYTQIFIDRAKSMNSVIAFAPELYQSAFSTYTSEKIRLFRIENRMDGTIISIGTDLLGDFQEENIITTLAAIEILNRKRWGINQETIIAGLKNVIENSGLRGRWEIIGENPRIVCDTGHNSEGIKTVINQIRNTPWKKLHMVLGFVNDKDLKDILDALPNEAIYYFTRSSVPRSLDQNILKKRAAEFNLSGESYPTVEQAFNKARKAAEPDDMIFIGGSTFVVADQLAIV